MNRLPPFLTVLLLTVTVLALAVITSFLTGFIIIGKEMAEIDTVGIIAHRGFPIWFAGVAPGISIMGSCKPDRFLLNTAVWAVAYLIAAFFIRGRGREKRTE